MLRCHYLEMEGFSHLPSLNYVHCHRLFRVSGCLGKGITIHLPERPRLLACMRGFLHQPAPKSAPIQCWNIQCILSAPQDEIVLRIVKQGLMDKDGKSFTPNIVRVGVNVHHSVRQAAGCTAGSCFDCIVRLPICITAAFPSKHWCTADAESKC